MRFEFLFECLSYVADYCRANGIVLADEVEVGPVGYGEVHRHTGPRSFAIASRKGKNTRSRLQVVVERFANGSYEVVCYAG